MAKKKQVFTPETLIPRSVKFEEDGKNISITYQPYISGLYQVVTIDGKAASRQVIEWGQLGKVIKHWEGIAKENPTLEFRCQPIGDFLKESDLAYMN